MADREAEPTWCAVVFLASVTNPSSRRTGSRKKKVVLSLFLALCRLMLCVGFRLSNRLQGRESIRQTAPTPGSPRVIIPSTRSR